MFGKVQKKKLHYNHNGVCVFSPNYSGGYSPFVPVTAHNGPPPVSALVGVSPTQHGARYPKQTSNKHNNNTGRPKHGSVPSRRAACQGGNGPGKQSSCFDYFYVNLSDSRTVKFAEIYPLPATQFQIAIFDYYAA